MKIELWLVVTANETQRGGGLSLVGIWAPTHQFCRARHSWESQCSWPSAMDVREWMCRACLRFFSNTSCFCYTWMFVDFCFQRFHFCQHFVISWQWCFQQLKVVNFLAPPSLPPPSLTPTHSLNPTTAFLFNRNFRWLTSRKWRQTNSKASLLMAGKSAQTKAPCLSGHCFKM